MEGLRPTEIHWIISHYIGVSGGYLGDFTYSSHREFYAAYCDLTIDPEDYPGTTRQRFLAVLSSADPQTQAAIVRGVARRFPVGSEVQRTLDARSKLLAMAKRCNQVAAVEPTSPRLASELVRQALADAASLLEVQGPVSALDRVHTALHGYLKTVCRSAGLDLASLPADPGVTQVFKLMRESHPALRDMGVQDDAMRKIVFSIGNILDSLNPLRNRGSLAHANDQLVERDEALLAINLTRSIIQYLDSKIVTDRNT
ncbi:abortive infection family protein [Stenotrophomonas maltophilia]|jgi:hypothetical protein|uniref:abortive infection family protein n=1 Tax=Stenotrophomonas maltophilia TaxID=40324 RepID=UPI000B4CCE4C|nr:abortive infection family protein [Stenotrophomonas maltophilia]MBH1689299.1 abortive infection family protein [Stenotrophomonas maltophilia]MBH1707463.1 abortive infection family protein [Stenotrophomonas maltophilia]MBH1847186.1 abortive infection family protein [Stenotrophomonas maltophilia]OWQ68364.1 hypothetical protein CEE57_15130 [Stenotrophomonas maltophilia]QGL68343.1 hypothetical protein FEO86_14050 [Stenotrophomonas maltophilia]